MGGIAKTARLLPLSRRDAPVLRQRAKTVRRVDDSIRALIDDMVFTMMKLHGVGLAAPQVGVPLRVVVMAIEKDVYSLVNPELRHPEGEQVAPEACLSLPGYYGETRRFRRLDVSGMNRKGQVVRISSEGLLAQVIQHELDHLEGLLFTDRLTSLSALKRLVLPGSPEE